jgi:hypothetical protein
MTDAVPVAALEPLEPGLAGGHGGVGLLAGKTPALDLFGVEPVAAAVFGKRVGTEACAVKDGSELLAGGPALGSVVMVGKQSPGLTGLPAPQVEGGGTDALLGSNPGDRFTCGPAEAGKNGLPALRWNGFHGIELISRSSSTPHLESQLRSLDNYPDTGGGKPHCSLRQGRERAEHFGGWQWAEPRALRSAGVGSLHVAGRITSAF